MWARIATIFIGVWLMIAPDLLHFNETAANNDHIIGPLIVSFSIISLSECTRNVKFMNLPLALWLLLTPLILGYNEWASDTVAAVLILLLTFIRQKRKKYFAGGWRSLWQSKENTPYSRSN